MTERIAVGDVVWIAKPTPCCGNTGAIGRVFHVSEIKTASWPCNYCGKCRESRAAKVDSRYFVDTLRLKRIPPLSELEGQRTEENIKEPA